MTKHEDAPEGDEEQDVTPEARALHGDRAQHERYEQPQAIDLPAGTRIATDDESGEQVS